MKKNTVSLFIVIIAAIAAGTLIYSFGKKIPSLDELPTLAVKKIGAGQKSVLPPATGNIDDTVNALLQEIIDEQTAAGSANDDKNLLFSDNQEISGFGHTANENEF